MSEQLRATCGDCGAKIGELHVPGCDVERCPDCGHQMISCDCEYEGQPVHRRLPWTGMWPGDAEAIEFGFYCRMIECKTGWYSCGKDAPGAEPDLLRLVAQCRWDADAGRWVKK